MMPTQLGPGIARRQLVRELRAARRHAGLTIDYVSRELGWSAAKLVRMENGSVGVSISDAMALADILGLQHESRDGLISLAKMAKRSGWWYKYRGVLEPHVQQFLAFEADATSIRVFQPTVIPGLLQIESYASAVGPPVLGHLEDAKILNLIRVRTLRKTFVLIDGYGFYAAIIDESVLLRHVGDATAMRDQFAFMCELVESGLLNLGILPLSQGAPFATLGGFHVMDYDRLGIVDALLWLDSAHDFVQSDDRHEIVSAYRRRFDEMMSVCWRGQDAIDRMQQAMP